MKRRVFYLYVGYQKAYNAFEDSHDVVTMSMCYDLTDTLQTERAILMYMEMKIVQLQEPTTDLICEYIAAANAFDTFKTRMKKAEDTIDSLFIMDRSPRFVKTYDDMQFVKKNQLRLMTTDEKRGAGLMLGSLQRLMIDPNHKIATVQCLNLKSNFSLGIKKYITHMISVEYFRVLAADDISCRLIKLDC